MDLQREAEKKNEDDVCKRVMMNVSENRRKGRLTPM